MNPQLETRHTTHNPGPSKMPYECEFFTPATQLLAACRWIYDLNMTELFCHDLFASFPASVRPSPPNSVLPLPINCLSPFLVDTLLPQCFLFGP